MSLLLQTVGQDRFEIIQKLNLETPITDILEEIDSGDKSKNDGWAEIRQLLEQAKMENQKPEKNSHTSEAIISIITQSIITQ